MSRVIIKFFGSFFFIFLAALSIVASVGCRPGVIWPVSGQGQSPQSQDFPDREFSNSHTSLGQDDSGRRTSEFLQEEPNESKWVSDAFTSGDGALQGQGLVPRGLFHFYRLEKRPNLNINQAKSKELTKTQVDELYQDINVLEVGRDGRSAFAGMAGGNLYALEIQRRGPRGKAFQLKRELLLADSRPILGLSLSPNEQYLAITRFGLVQIFDRVEKRTIAQLSRVETRLVAIDWDPRGDLVVFGGVGGDIYTWNVFDGPGAGRDTLDAVEQYEGDSPVLQLVFHPSGRAFFAAQQNGLIVFWRLLRTERELGLRDDAARVDSQRRGLVSALVGSLPGQPEDIWLEDGGAKLYVSAVDGKIHRWKVRGLEPESSISIGVERSSNAKQLPFVISGEKRAIRTMAIRPFVTTGRGQRVSFFCPKAPDEKANPTVVSVFSSEISQPVETGARIVNGQIQEASETPAPSSETAYTSTLTPLAESARLDTPIKDFSTGIDSAVLWAIQKGGTLVVFDAGQLRNLPWFEDRLLRCLSQPGS